MLARQPSICARCECPATPGAALCAPCAVEAATECPGCYTDATGPLCDACGPCKRCEGTGLVAYQIDVDDIGYYDCDCAAGEARTDAATDAAVERMESRRAALGMVL